MRINELARRLKGIQTIETITSSLKVSRQKAIYLIYRLRRKGYVKTKYTPKKKRVYYVSEENTLGGESYIEIINKYSPVKISEGKICRIYGRKLTIEETLIYAVKSQDLRYILASLALFKKIKNWKLLYSLAKKSSLAREIFALYELARENIKKTRRADKRVLRHVLKQERAYKYIVPKLKSKDFKEIEKKWKVYIPFNKQDLEDYK